MKREFTQALTNRGFAYLRIGEVRRAIADFDRSLEINPAQFAPFFGRGVAWEKLNDLVQANRDYAAARAIDPQGEQKLRAAGLMP